MSDDDHVHGAGLDDCRGCRELWMKEVGGRCGTCMVCDHRHWPWEPHESGLYEPPATAVAETGTCLLCGEPCEPGDLVEASFSFNGDGSVRPERVHAECQALPITGHTYGVCFCYGYGSDRAAAKELWRRMQSGQTYVDRILGDGS